MINFEELSLKDINQVKLFLDNHSGEDYLTKEDLKDIIENKSKYKNLNCSFVAKDGDKIVGVRITYAPTKWISSAKGITIKKWKKDECKVAKFHCLFLDEKYQGQGIGPQLSNKSIDVLVQMGAEAIICHSWLESPNNSSQRYLKKYGFESVALHENFWADLDYFCSGCSRTRCICTAEEMIYYIN